MRHTRAGCGRSSRATSSSDDLRKKRRQDDGEPVPVSAGDLLALGGDHPRRLSRARERAAGARGRRHPPRELRHLARRRRSPGLGRERLRRSGRDALCARPGAAGDQRAAGAPCAAWRQDHLRRHPGGIPARASSDPRPFVLDEDHAWLRELVVASEADRAEFWTEHRQAEAVEPRVPPSAIAARSRRRCRIAASRSSSVREPQAPGASGGRAGSGSPTGAAAAWCARRRRW